MKRFVVFTTIHEPSEAVRAWVNVPDTYVIGVGDKKTPIDWKVEGCHMISAWQQGEIKSDLAKALPWNSYARKMIGYRVAIDTGAEVIIDTDDDNIPKPDWSVPLFDGPQYVTATNKEWFNTYRIFSDRNLWPRGFPLEKIIDSRTQDTRMAVKTTRVGVWQCLANGDPDVDAIYRLIDNEPIIFKEHSPIVLDRGVWCPFNSQNTVWRKELFPLLYLPTTVNMRVTDILRSLVAQAIMSENGGYQLGFTRANAIQKRNPHNYLDDFKDEVPIYLNAQRIINTVRSAIHWKNSILRNLALAYSALIKEGIVSRKENNTLDQWLKDFLL